MPADGRDGRSGSARQRTLIALLVTAMACSLAACGGGGSSAPEPSGTTDGGSSGGGGSGGGTTGGGTTGGSGSGGTGSGSSAGGPVVQILSSKPEYVTGGSALVDVAPAAGTAATAALSVTLNGANVSANFKPDPSNSGHMVAVVNGLQNGANTLVADYGGTKTSIALTNYPMTGPVFSGPQISPFICETQSFTLPDGSTLGTPTDGYCSAPTKVTYMYRSTSGTVKPLPGTSALPADVATTTTTSGKNVPFVIRVETGTADRGIYQNAVLYDPTKDPAPTPLAAPAGWNKRLIVLSGTGCTGGWYIQGNNLGNDLLSGDNLTHLGQGYGLFTTTLNNPSNSCNATLAAESTMMAKEHFIKTFGAPVYTVATGSSGGAYTSLQMADAYPGLIDGVFVTRAFPDALTIANTGLDAHLLSHYYYSANSAGLTEAQMVAVSGQKSASAWYDIALQSGRADPVPNRSDPLNSSDLGGYKSGVWDPAVPSAQRYNPASNPHGARPTIFDVARNVYGVDPANGFALRPFDNTGVQYGLSALNAGVISKAQFLDLNAQIGGYDEDANFIGSRSVADAGSIQRAYQSDMLLTGAGGLASIPVFDLSGTYDEDYAYHYQWFHFAVRERIAQANGDARNYVMWRGDPSASSGASASALTTQAWNTFIQWMEAYKANNSSASQRDKVIASKPGTAVDGCFAKSSTLQFIAEPQTFSSQPTSQCNQLWPSYGFPRYAAGEDVRSNTLKCQLKPVSQSDYTVSFTADEMARLNSIFPNGVCDWSKPGVNQTTVVPNPSFGPSPVNLVFNIGHS